MEIRLLGNSAVSINAVGLGAMPLSLSGRPNEAIAYEIIKTFVENGGDFIDTANVYCATKKEIGHNEHLISSILKKLGKETEIQIATKGGLRRTNDSWLVDASPTWLRASCENSLIALNRHSIFLYQLHAPDPDIPILESIGELVRLRDEGLIQYIGLSNVTREQIRQVIEHTDILTVQNQCNLFKKEDISNGLVNYCYENNITYICHSCVGGHYQHKHLMQEKRLVALANQYEVTPYMLALSWVLHQSKNIVVIPGATKVESIKNSLASNSVKLARKDLSILEQLY